MGSRVSPVLTPKTHPPSKSGATAVAAELKSLIRSAGSVWTQLTEPVEGMSGKIATNFAARVSELAGQLPEPLHSMAVSAGPGTVYYTPKATPPFYDCIHRVETSVRLGDGEDEFMLGFQIPCTDCLS
jgi:hypothetical protein